MVKHIQNILFLISTLTILIDVHALKIYVFTMDDFEVGGLT